jgi:L-threonylcarbamoyladenylate synthase
MTVLFGEPHAIAAHARAHQSPNTGYLFSTETAKLLNNAQGICLPRGDDLEAVAYGLYANLRAFDDLNVTQIFAEGVEASGLGVAVMDRMSKAAEGRIVHV